MSLKTYALQHPKMKGRIALDYPLDILLNRKCKLRDYERGAMSIWRDYNAEIDRILIGKIKDFEKKFKEQINEENNQGTASLLKWNESEENRIENREKFKKKISNQLKDFSAWLNKREEWLNNFIEVSQYNDRKIGVLELPETPRDDESLEKAKEIFNHLLDKIEKENNRGAASLLKWEESEEKRIKNREEFKKKISPKFIKFSAWLKNHDEWLNKFIEVYQYCDGEIGGLELPDTHGDDTSQKKDADKPGTGNILIRGKPGTGKSTLALQLAISCTWRPNRYSSIFFSLEESYENILSKAVEFGWEDKIRRVDFLEDVSDSSSSPAIGEALKRLLTQPAKCPMHEGFDNVCDGGNHFKFKQNSLIEPCVLIPLLSPRTITPSDRGADALFWERYKQLEKLLIASRYLREGEDRKRNRKSDSDIADGIPDIRMVCIDNLNVFGDELLTRTEMFKLFDLLKRFGMIGVITAENDPKSSDLADYLADVVIQLQKEEDEGYALRYLEISKSRYQHEVYGRHPLRMRGQEIFTEHRKPWITSDELGNIAKEIGGFLWIKV